MSAPKYYTWNTDTKKFESEHTAQLDPLETEKAGHEVYCGLPQNGTYEVPLEPKEGFDVIWNGSAWEYREIPQPEPEPEPTPEQKQEMVRVVRNGYLSATDFTQLADAPFSVAEKATYAEYRQYLRDYTKGEDWWEQNPATFEEWETAHSPVTE